MQRLPAASIAFTAIVLLASGTSPACAIRARREHRASLDLRLPTFVATRVASSDASMGGGYALLVATTEVTQGQWRRVMGSVPRNRMPRDDSPVVYVSWYDAASFANAMSAREGLAPCYALDACDVAPRYARRMDGTWAAHASGLACDSAVSAGPTCDGYRLPTRDEWLALGRVAAVEDSGEPASDYAVYGRISSNTNAAPVATRRPNEIGAYDTLGNVDEWLDDRSIPPAAIPAIRQNQADQPWFGTASTCFGTRERDLSSARTEVEVGSWGRNCLGFRLVRTQRASASAP